ncbi:MAG: hypothetical protein AAGG46_12950, partial [Planctomycetota bacterium]
MIPFACITQTGVAATPLADETPWFRLIEATEEADRGGCQLAWQGVPLADAVSRLPSACGVFVFLDRRIDPTTRIHSASGGGSAMLALDGVASRNGWGLARIGAISYLGPGQTARDLPTRVANRLLEL